MSENLIAAVIGAGLSLIIAVVTLSANAFIEKYKSKLEIRQKEHQTKRERLDKAYKELISIINLYPDSSPNDVMQYIEYPPAYLLESFDSTLRNLDYKIEDYKEQFKNANINLERKHDIEAQISNIEYSKKKISETRDKYFNARDKYNSFFESDKAIFDLYAGQDVRNCIVEFEVLIDNVFIAGRSVEVANDPQGNWIKIYRRNLIDSMRNDLGINRNN